RARLPPSLLRDPPRQRGSAGASPSPSPSGRFFSRTSQAGDPTHANARGPRGHGGGFAGDPLVGGGRPTGFTLRRPALERSRFLRPADGAARAAARRARTTTTAGTQGPRRGDRAAEIAAHFPAP